MKRKLLFNLLLCMMASLMLGGCGLIENLFFTKTQAAEFSFSGVVWADGEPLSEAVVSCGIASTTTDENGTYRFLGINKVVQVNVTKEGYLFPKNLVFVNSTSSDINFNGFKIFEKSGVVKYNNVCISDVKLIATSENGEYETMSNEYGEFYLPNLAGNVKVVATHSKYKFFTQSFNIAKEDSVVITGTTSIGGKIQTDAIAIKDDFKLTLDEKIITINEDLTFDLNNVYPESIIKLESEDFHITDNQFGIVSCDEEIMFDCQKYYDINGIVKSGDTHLSNAIIVCGDKNFVTSDGSFALTKLYGEVEIIASVEGFKFESQKANFDNREVILNGVKDCLVFFNFVDNESDENLKLDVDGEIIEISPEGGVIHSVSLGEQIRIVSDKYYVDNNSQSVSMANLTFDLYQIYDSQICVNYDNSPLIGSIVTFANMQYATNENGQVLLSGLHGENEIFLSKDGYSFETKYVISFDKQNINIVPNILFDLNCCVKSGDLILNNATINFCDVINEVDENGNFQISGLSGQVNVLVKCDGYNDFGFVATKDNNNVLANLSYDISGQVLSANRAVIDAQVIAGEISCVTDENGFFQITGLYDNNNIEIQKDGYTFSSKLVCNSQELVLTGTYSISGKASSADGCVSGLKMTLLNLQDFTQINIITDVNGNYSFAGLDSDYLLFYDTSYEGILKPAHYNVYMVGTYDFADNGYGFGGKITCGNIGLDGVKVSVGDMSTYSNENGDYYFDLLTKPGILSLSKLGYTFANNGQSVDDTFDMKNNVNFESTYEIVGTIKSGSKFLGQVEVTIGDYVVMSDNNGAFRISNLTGTNQIILQKDGFKFGNIDDIDSYANIEINGTFDITLEIASGDTKVSGVIAKSGEEYQSNELGIINIPDVKFGDVIELSKEGYNIDNYVIENYSSDKIAIETTYNVWGYILNIDTPLSDVEVRCGDIITSTDDNGYFEINNLSGENAFSFVKNGFDFEDKTISNGGIVEIHFRYMVDGYVRIGDTPLNKVEVKAGDIFAITNAMGYFQLSGLDSRITIEFVKTGYEFTGDCEVSAPRTLNISATYSISGLVKSGDVILSNVKVTAENGESTTTDSNGYYILYGFNSKTSLTFEKIDASNVLEYNTFTKSNIVGYLNNCDINLFYNVIVRFSGVSDYSNITIQVGDNETIINESTSVLENLQGENVISFSKTNCKFSPAEYLVDKAMTISTAITIVYSVSGYVTSDGVAIVGAKVTAGDSTAVTDNYGKYTLRSLEGTRLVKVELPSWESTHYVKDAGQVSKAGTLDINIATNDFVYNLFKFAYGNLDNAKSYQIYGTGDVHAVPSIGSAQDQKISTIYKKDTNGLRLAESLNYGSEVFGIDPRVSLLTIVDTTSKSVKYIEERGDSVRSDRTCTYGNNWSSDMTYAEYSGKFGVSPVGFLPYNINTNTIDGFVGLTFAEGYYNFTMNLKTTAEMYSNYEKQMKFMMSSQTLESFEYVKLNYQISTDGFIKTLVINEKYTVSAMGATVPTTATINFEYLTESLDEYIPNIDVSSSSAISQSLTRYNTQTISETPIDLYVPQKRRYVL